MPSSGGTLPPRGEGLARGAGRRARPPCRRRRGLSGGEAGRDDPDVGRRPDRGHVLPSRRHAARGRVACDRLPARALRQPPADERAGRGLRLHRRELRDPHLRRARPRGVRRARRHRRAARGRRRPCDPRLARGAGGRLGHEDRRLGHLVRRWRGLQLARRRCAVDGGRDGRDVDRPLLRAHAAGTREVRPRRRARRVDPTREARPVARRRSGRSLRRQRRSRPHVGRRAFEQLEARLGRDARLHGAGAAGLPLRDRPGDAGVRAPEGAQGAVRRPPWPRAVDVPRGRHGLAPVQGTRLVRLLPARDGLRREPDVGLPRVREVQRPGRPPRRDAASRHADHVAFPGVTTFARSGKAVRTSAPLRMSLEIFGAPTVQTSIAASGGWSRLVAVLTARTRQGKEIVVAAGGVPTKPGVQKVTIRLGRARRRSFRRGRA